MRARFVVNYTAILIDVLVFGLCLHVCWRGCYYVEHVSDRMMWRPSFCPERIGIIPFQYSCYRDQTMLMATTIQVFVCIRCSDARFN
jgi:hypothetical protein